MGLPDCPRLGSDDDLPKILAQGIEYAFVAIGDNRIRRKCAAMVERLGFSTLNAASAHSVISSFAKLGKLVAVMPGAIINVGSEIGDGVIVNTNATIDHDCRIGAFAHVAPGVALAGNVTIGDEAFIGIGARVIPGIKIGARTIVGAGAVVIRDLPDGVVAVGVPATIRKD